MKTADVIRGQIQQTASLLKSDLEDLDKRISQGTKADMTFVAARALMVAAMRLVELTAELKGAETGWEECEDKHWEDSE